MSNHEDGEILEEGEEVEDIVNSCSNDTSSSIPTSAAINRVIQPPPFAATLPLASRCQNPRKRLHSSLQNGNHTETASIYDKRTPLSHHQKGRYNNHRSSSYRRDVSSNDDRVYDEDLIIKHPRQQPCSNVLLNFATWMGSANRLDIEDVQSIILNVLRGDSSSLEGVVSPYLLPYLTPRARLPSKVCVILIQKMHPSVLQKYRSKLNFFDQCSSMPVVLKKHDSTQIRRSEAPLPELLYTFPKPTVDTHELSTDELYYAHELTFLMKHSAGFTDELVFNPTGTFTRRSQPIGGTWVLDGDLLHLKWRQRTMNVALDINATMKGADTAMDEVEDDAYTLDVLVSQDESMHEFRTDKVTDETYAREVPEHLAKKSRNDKPRSIWLSLAKAIAIDVPRSVDGSLILQKKKVSVQTTLGTETSSKVAKEEELLTREAFEYYLLSREELVQHGFPIYVEEEQRRLVEATKGGTRDNYVATKPRPTIPVDDSSAFDKIDLMETEEVFTKKSLRDDFVYALDCEMCETDLGMELTRVTVVDIRGTVVYDQLVKPQSTILNYHTEFSGISEETLRETKYILADVQRDLTTQYLFEDTILVGHSLTSDLRALRLVHLTIGDTAILYPHQRGFPFRTSLKFLTKTYLKKDIQMQIQTGHDSAEDAIASLELLLLKIRNGPWFGIPSVVASSCAFDSIVDKVSALDKSMKMLRLRSHDEIVNGARQTKRKPWDLFASGDFKIQSQSPFCHAHLVEAKDKTGASKTVANALKKIDTCESLEELKNSIQIVMDAQPSEQPDLCWVEIEPPRVSTTQYNDFVGNHELWMGEQQAYCEQVNAFMQQVRDEVLPKDMLLLVLPQGDLSLLRYLKGLQTRSKWRDATPTNDDAPEELHAAVGDAFRGAMESCLFLMQNR
ncbi:small rna degrading nuclease 5-like isoform x1 [Plasmopara halstedii]|uniref:Small rna degrading nuclease 5-like isoform x1 n=1 Tax=Plasmopara halstedii TaxID=4781 RepID=A0A0P1AWY2_PLAHL|nr:small rna degrading nuclease 5-like isoform x1 [Plasmopara halstedii]CEG45982.1 small rna degrading nuclease 5-like isoform x1 [Plasmopara halstedii]|eukprot:XP_024582351.1 small rna degrading nuclease 5-like isoform x1 [Plasmopara halstedii]